MSARLPAGVRSSRHSASRRRRQLQHRDGGCRRTNASRQRAQLPRDARAQVVLESSDAAPYVGTSGYWSTNTETEYGTHATDADEGRSAHTESDRHAHEREETDQWYLRGVFTVHDPY